MTSIESYKNQIYAGVLGKMIGVYLGRPVENQTYENIREQFGEIAYYIHEQRGVPLIVPDDDISGTFTFFRALKDHGNSRGLCSEQIGQSWLNYLIEGKTILWWGGMGRSTEHTAFLNLKNGIKAPKSGSIAQNGKTIAEQIGAQIFIDAFAMACPDDPELAVHLIREAASVSHDGIAVSAACYLGAMESMAFSEKRVDVLMEQAKHFISDSRLLALIEDVQNTCAQHDDWRGAREVLAERYSLEKYPGQCHMVPNHALILMSLLKGGDNFQESMKIVVSSGWDTDCNAGNLGCLNGIRLGLSGIEAGADFRTPVADRAFIISSDGGSVISDAVIETRKILESAAALRGEKKPAVHPRFDFEYPGSLQGFEVCPYSRYPYAVRLRQTFLSEKDSALEISCQGIGEGMEAEVSTATFLERKFLSPTYPSVASPTLYEGQTIHAVLSGDSGENITVAPYILYYGYHDEVKKVLGEPQRIVPGKNTIEWEIPSIGGRPIFRIGFSVRSQKGFTGSVFLESLDWQGAPKRFAITGPLVVPGEALTSFGLLMWASDIQTLYSNGRIMAFVSHPENHGLLTIGTKEWENYRVRCRFMPSLHKSFGLIARSEGHRRYYAAQCSDCRTAEIVLRCEDQETVLKTVPFAYEEDRFYDLSFTVNRNRLSFSVDGKCLIETADDTYSCGAAGILISCGTCQTDGFTVEAE